jgi:hypothetical protein
LGSRRVNQGGFLVLVLNLALPPAASIQFDRRVNCYVSVKNSKSQMTNSKQITMTKIPKNKPGWLIGYWDLGFPWYLVLGI